MIKAGEGSDFMKKKIGIKTMIAILVPLILLTAAAVLFFVLHFQVIVVEGNEQVAQETVIDQVFPSKLDRSLGMVLFHKLTNQKEPVANVETYDLEIMSWKELKITVYEKKKIGYFKYMGNYMYFDKDGVVIGSSSEAPEKIPEVRGLHFEYVVLNEKLPIQDPDVFSDLLAVTQMIDKYEMQVQRIQISDTFEITLIIDAAKIALGNDDYLNEKMSDLHDILPHMDTKKAGTLDMTVYQEDGEYTFQLENSKKTEKK